MKTLIGQALITIPKPCQKVNSLYSWPAILTQEEKDPDPGKAADKRRGIELASITPFYRLHQSNAPIPMDLV